MHSGPCLDFWLFVNRIRPSSFIEREIRKSSYVVRGIACQVAMVVIENRNLQKKISESETAFTSKITLLEMEIDLEAGSCKRDRRLEKYENSDSPSSKDSLYNAERAASESGWRGRMQTAGRT